MAATLTPQQVSDLYDGIYGPSQRAQPGRGALTPGDVDALYRGIYGQGAAPQRPSNGPSTRAVQSVPVDQNGRPVAQTIRPLNDGLTEQQLRAIREVGTIRRIPVGDRLTPGASYDTSYTRPETAAEAANRLFGYSVRNLNSYAPLPGGYNGYVARPRPMTTNMPAPSLTAPKPGVADPGLGGLFGAPAPAGIPPQVPPSGMEPTVFGPGVPGAIKPPAQQGSPMSALASLFTGGGGGGGAAPKPVPAAGQRAIGTNGYAYETDGRGGYVRTGTTRAVGQSASSQYDQANARARASRENFWDRNNNEGDGGGRSLTS